MSRFLLLILSLFVVPIFIAMEAIAAPRILHSNAQGNGALWLILKKETKGKYLLQLTHEGVKEPESFKLTADTTGSGNIALKFTTGEEARATAALKGVEDVIMHTAANNADAAGDASGDINTFVNDVLRKDGGEGVLILPAALTPANLAPQKPGGDWLWLLGGLVAGIAGCIVVMRMMAGNTKDKDPVDEEDTGTPEVLPATPENAAAGAAQAAKKLKKAQEDLGKAKAALTQMTRQAESERVKNEAHEEDYKALEARLKTGDANSVKLQSGLAEAQKELLILRGKAIQQDTYFKSSANSLVRPFTDFVSGSRINPADEGSQAIVEEQLVIMGLHYYSLVRYSAGIWDEHDVYNIQHIGGLAAGQKATEPSVVPIDIKSGAPNLVLSVAELLRKTGANGAGMNVSMHGYRFGQQ